MKHPYLCYVTIRLLFIASNHVFYEKTKYVEIYYHFVRNVVKDSKLSRFLLFLLGYLINLMMFSPKLSLLSCTTGICSKLCMIYNYTLA